jgi:DedD protein
MGFSLFGKKKQDSDDELDIPVKPRRRAKAQEEEPLDPMLPEKKRARRRLIGATALVLAAVIGLPMIFDTEPKPLSDDVAVQIPARDKTGPNNSTPLPLPPSTEPAPHEPAKTEAPKAEPIHPEPAKLELPKAEPAKPELNKLIADKAADKPAEKVADKPADKAKTDKLADKTAAKTEKMADSKADKDKGRYLVQVAAVTSKAKAEELQNRLKKSGIKSYSQKVSTRDGERYRIRVGPFGSRDEADKMRSRLGKMGLSAAIQPV